jgi:uncharacterized membrane protein YidH (DUF202 family)
MSQLNRRNALTAVASITCCLPLGFAGAAGAFGLGVAFAAWRPWLIGLSVFLLGLGAWQWARTGRSCRRRSRLSIVLLSLSAVVVLGVMFFPQRIAALMADYLP